MAFYHTWLFIFFPPYLFFGPRLFHLLVVGGGLIAYLVLFSELGLWETRSYKPTEQEKVLSCKATSKTLVAFSTIFFIVMMFILAYNRAEWTVEFYYIAAASLTVAMVFTTVKSYVLFAFLRGERIRNAKQQPEM